MKEHFLALSVAALLAIAPTGWAADTKSGDGKAALEKELNKEEGARDVSEETYYSVYFDAAGPVQDFGEAPKAGLPEGCESESSQSGAREIGPATSQVSHGGGAKPFVSAGWAALHLATVIN